jgi:3-phenylpropionate/cinnamic acid dioxygenase small subunit
MIALHHKVAQFLYHEAALADRHAYAEWLALWAEDCSYWIPCNDDDTDPETHVALIYERRVGLEDRVRRLSGNYAHTQQPRSRISRVIANVMVEQLPDGLISANSSFNLTAFRRQVMETFAGRMHHVLHLDGDSYLIVRKTIYLANNDGYIGNMTFLM